MLKSLFTQTIAPMCLQLDRIHSYFTSQNQVAPLILHDVAEHQFAKLDELLRALRQRHEFITPEEFQLIMSGKQQQGRKILLTFDDGFYSNKKAAQEVLALHGIKAIFFVVTDFVTKPDPQKIKDKLLLPAATELSDVKMMSWEDLASLQNQGHAIGSHSCSHLRFSQLSESEAKHQIVESKLAIQQHLNLNTPFFAYPFGDADSVNANSLQCMYENYQYVFSGTRGKNCYPSKSPLLWRESIDLDQTLTTNQFVALGGFRPFYSRHRTALKRTLVHANS